MVRRDAIGVLIHSVLAIQGYIVNIEKETVESTDYRRVLCTTPLSQLVLMCIEPGDEIGEEVYELDQFIRLEQGEVTVTLNGESHVIKDDVAVVTPAGTRHNMVNAGSEPVKLYSVYTSLEHKHTTVHATKTDDAAEHFDGETSL